ncbi:MAG TPA: 1-acyl-sn-glycerol-3-phosphate acyltransferase, partial [Verrucomicrobiae bacterium]|nr:1-acyl-sn-glycerol-3-phosphate acyltransferase [Verrucomicrobiae bacterium]
HTGDIGERDEAGNLYFKGRRKNVIVTPEGLNIFPQDLEVELRKEPSVRDCVVIALERDGNAQPCAVLILKDAANTSEAAATVQRANERLAPFQRMQHWFVWPDADFPRTPTQKPALGRIREAAEAALGGRRSGSSQAAPSGSIGELLKGISRGRLPSNESASLQLGSIERVELLSTLEDRYQVDLSETEFASANTIEALEKLIAQPSRGAVTVHYPRWPQSWPARLLRAAVFAVLVRPALLILGWPRVSGRENLRNVKAPTLVISNHVTYFDPVLILHALPARLRHRLAVAMDGERLESMRNPSPDLEFFSGLLNRTQYFLALALFNVFPLPRQAGFRKSFAFAGDLIDRGWSVLIFPEGELTRDGRIAPFRAGVGLLAAGLGAPVVPARLDGLFALKQAGKRRAAPGQIKITLGAPISIDAGRPAEAITRDLQQHVAGLAENGGK